MQTTLAESIRNSPQGREADAILRKCVHCGFCLATCPTYQLLGDELDSPRGRIYLMKQMLEGEAVSEHTQLHLDRCLTCRACETTCPSGVQYGRLLEIGRAVTEERVPRSVPSTFTRNILCKVVPYTRRFAFVMGLARLARPLLPSAVRKKLPARGQPAVNEQQAAWPAARHARKVLVLDGCVQPVLAPGINLAAVRVLDTLGISAIRAVGAGCCGAVTHHLSVHKQTLAHAKRNIDALWPHIEAGAEAIVVTASACASMLTDYGHLLRDDPEYAARAARVSELARDVSEVVAAERHELAKALQGLARDGGKVAFHSPCTLQHGLKIRGVVESLLTAAGFTLTHVPDAHLCCGSAGTYSILQPELSERLLQGKVRALEGGAPAVIATANIGCLTHIGGGTSLPVRHWVELIAGRLEASASLVSSVHRT